jgi:hypothetical protein
MTDARYDGIQWSDAQEAVGLNCLSNFDAAFYQNAKAKPKWVADTNEVLCAGMIKALLDAHRMVWCAQLRYDIRTGAPVEFPSFGEMVTATPNPVGAQETRAKVRQFCAGDPAIAAVPALYDVLVFEVQQAIRSSRPIQEPKPAAGLSGVELGAVPVALIALGVAALAGATYLGSTASIEFSKAWSAIEIEKAWAVQRAWAEVQIASQKIAAGQTVELSDWSKMRSAVASASGSNAGPLIIAGALAVVVAGGAYLLREHKSTPSYQNPVRRLVPRRRRNPSHDPYSQAANKDVAAWSNKSKAQRQKEKRQRKRDEAHEYRTSSESDAAPKRKRNAARVGFGSRLAAENASARFNTSPRAIELVDGSWGGVMASTVGDDGRHGVDLVLPRRRVYAPDSRRLVKRRNPAPKRKRNAAPKRKRNAAPKRKRNPGTVSHVRPSGKFMRSQRAKGRSNAQARAAWKLSHGKRAKKA